MSAKFIRVHFASNSKFQRTDLQMDLEHSKFEPEQIKIRSQFQFRILNHFQAEAPNGDNVASQPQFY